MMKAHTLAFTFALLLVAPFAGAVTIDSLSLHLHLKNLDHAEEASVRDGYLILTLGGVHRFVGAAFAHENFVRIHPFERNDKGIFILAWKIPTNSESPLAYRLVIDGAWIADPGNPRRSTINGAGLTLSLVTVPWLSDELPGIYEVLAKDGKTARFLFKGRPGENISVAGSFNNWDPFVHTMEEREPGRYELQLELPPGIQLYNFVLRGQMITDPLNSEKATNRYERSVSILRVGSKPVPGDPTITPIDLKKAETAKKE
ncbi:MAG: glycogen-binding domain-containing protein [Rectinemataceae bacterium]